MKINGIKLEWYAFKYDTNKQKLVFTNVLSGMEKDIAKKIKKGIKDNYRPVYNYNTFRDYISSELRYKYWCRTEYEVNISDLFATLHSDVEKHDIWWQLEPNIDRICEYIMYTMQIEF